MLGKMRNQGIEIGINAVPVRTKDFEWKTTATFATNATKLISLSNDLYETANEQDIAYLGEPITDVNSAYGSWKTSRSVVWYEGCWYL